MAEQPHLPDDPADELNLARALEEFCRRADEIPIRGTTSHNIRGLEIRADESGWPVRTPSHQLHSVAISR
jgi:hypothetical protein